MDQRNAKILAFLKETIGTELSLDSELLESGLMDSFKAVTLIAFIETEFEVRVDPGDMAREYLATPAAIASFVAQLQSRVPAPPA